MPKFENVVKIALLPLCLFFGGCTTLGINKNPENDAQISDSGNSSFVHDSLSKAADGVYAELKFLNDSSGRRAPTVTLPNPISGCLIHLVSVDYDGSASKFIEDFKGSGFCQVRVIGKAPPQDLILTLHHHRVPLWHVIEDMGVQMGSQANVEMTDSSIVIRFHGQVAETPVASNDAGGGANAGR